MTIWPESKYQDEPPVSLGGEAEENKVMIPETEKNLVPVMREKDRKMIALTRRMRDASGMWCIMW